MTAVAYIRRSASEESPVSEELQRSTIARLAAERGDTIAHVYRDWGKSGSSETRPQYVAMLAQAEADGIHAIYAYDQDRLARSNFLFASLLRLADVRGFSVITPAGDLADDRYRDFAEMRGLMDGAELRKMRKRSRAIAAKRRERGDDMGQVPYGYSIAPHGPRPSEPIRFVRDDAKIEHVIETYKRVGTYIGTARALNAEGWPSARLKVNHRTGLPPTWHATTVKGVIDREAPELTTPVRRGTRGPGRPRFLAGLLRCHCGGPMTPGMSGKGSALYYCGRGQRGGHPAPHGITEARLMPWVRDEAARLLQPGDILTGTDDYDDSADRARLEAARDLIGEDAYRVAVAALDAKRGDHDSRVRDLADIPPAVDFERWSVEDVNAALRMLWERVDLGADLLPVAAEWRYPEWRRD